jgi:hypothetical protein
LQQSRAILLRFRPPVYIYKETRNSRNTYGNHPPPAEVIFKPSRWNIPTS